MTKVRTKAGPGIGLIDSAPAMAEIMARQLAKAGLENPRRSAPTYRFQTIGEHFLGRTLANVEIVKW